MIRFALSLALVALLALPARAADTTVSLLPAAGQRVRYRVVRTVQTATVPASTTTLFDLVRRTDATIVIERHDSSGSPNVSVLKVGPDGSLALAEDPRGTAADADLTDLLFGINTALAATRNADAAARSGWAATVPVAAARGSANAVLTMYPMNFAGTDFDFNGQAEAGLAAPNAAASSAPERRSGGRSRGGLGGGIGGISFPGGGGGGGGFPGGGGGGGRSRGGSQGDDGGTRPAGGPNNGVVTTVRVEGHATAGHVNRVTITQTRTVTVAAMPFVNVGSWSVTVVK